jgi:hypothetical protein
VIIRRVFFTIVCQFYFLLFELSIWQKARPGGSGHAAGDVDGFATAHVRVVVGDVALVAPSLVARLAHRVQRVLHAFEAFGAHAHHAQRIESGQSRIASVGTGSGASGLVASITARLHVISQGHVDEHLRIRDVDSILQTTEQLICLLHIGCRTK